MNANRLRRGRAIAALLLGAAAACSEPPAGGGPAFSTQPPAQATPVHVFAVYPLHNPAKLLAAYQPIVDHVNRRLQGAQLALEASRDYAAFEAKVQARGPALILPNPLQALQAMRRGYRVIAMVGVPAEFRGIFVVRRDGHLTRPTDLKGAAVAYPSPTAHAACILPQWFLHTRGLDVRRDLENLYVGSEESAILNAYLGRVAAAATWYTPWRAFVREHPAEAAELKVIWETEPVMANAVMARDDVPAELAARIREILVELGTTAEGQALLGAAELSGFHPASDRDYEVARIFLARFEREVRPLEAR
jgi:phosphonate transport system substrate-binding protein